MLLLIDAVVNLVVGILLLFFPFGIAACLGIPETDTNFYPSLLGAVLSGIGIALLIDLFGAQRGIRGLGLGGAIAINIVGAAALLLWLVLVPFQIPTRGLVLLWSVAVIVILIGFAEILAKAWKY